MGEVDAPGTTPLSHLATPQSWWAGVDTEDHEAHHNSAGDSGIATNERHQAQPISAAQGEEGLAHHQQRVGGDPKKIFGVLPNSSFNVRYLADPIQREVELRAAVLRGRPSVGVTISSGTEPTSTTVAVGEASEAPPRDALGGSNADFWKRECSRLQDQLGSVARDQEMWGRDRMRLLSEDSDRARDLAGLRRAVESQSQLVMESLVAAQRLAAANAPMPEERTITQGAQQYPWVQPWTQEDSSLSGRTAIYGPPQTVTAVPGPLMYGDTIPNPVARTHTTGAAPRFYESERSVRQAHQEDNGARRVSWDIPLPSRTGLATSWIDGGYTKEGVAEGGDLDRDAGQGSTHTRDHRHNSASSAAVTQTSSRTGYYLPAVGSGRGSDAILPSVFPDSTMLGSRGFTSPYQSPLRDGVVGNSKMYRNRSRSDWRRVVDSSMEDEHNELWEWNGRKVMFQVAPPKGSKVRQPEVTRAGKNMASPRENQKCEDAPPTDAAATESTILLDEIQEIKASLKALIGEITAHRLSHANSGERSSLTEETTAQLTTVSTSHTHEPKLSDAGYKVPGPSPSPEMVSSRRVSLPASPRQLTSLPILEEVNIPETTGELGQALAPGMQTTYVSAGSRERENPESTSRSKIDGSGDDNSKGGGIHSAVNASDTAARQPFRQSFEDAAEHTRHTEQHAESRHSSADRSSNEPANPHRGIESYFTAGSPGKFSSDMTLDSDAPGEAPRGPARALIGSGSSGGASSDAALIQEVRARGSVGAEPPSSEEQEADSQRSATHMTLPREDPVAAENGKSTTEVEGCNDSPDEAPVRAGAEVGTGLVPITDSLSEWKQLPGGTATVRTRFEETAGVGNGKSTLEGPGIAVDTNGSARSS